MKDFNAPFIKSGTVFDNTDHSSFPAPIFRRRFYIDKVGKAMLKICALGYGYSYINGKPVTKDLFCAPVSEYDKLVWYNEYEISDLLKEGENVFAIILGNGFFNENFPTVWKHNEANWRDNPKFALSISIDDNIVLESDERFLYTENSFVSYNQLRSGETFDARLYNEAWKNLDFDDSAFIPAIIDYKMECVQREKCCCEPIREFEEYDFISAKKTNDGYLLDFGVNISGYLRVNVSEKCGTVIEMSHAEEANEDGTLKLNGLNIYYLTVNFQTDRYICGDENYIWSPKFTYHGFRYVFVKGLTKPPKKGEFKSIFVHQAVKRTSEFECSNELLNKIFEAGIRSTYSNMFYVLTDCPTREKLGWTNDTQLSCEQLYMNFDIKDFMYKWEKDMFLSMRESGEISAVIPNNGFGYDHGPVADGLIFELPYMEYLQYGTKDKLLRYLPYMKRYYNIYTGLDRTVWLGDWDGRRCRFRDVDFVYYFYVIKFCDIMIKAQGLAGEAIDQRYETDKIEAIKNIREKYILPNGKAILDSQPLIAMLIHLNISDKKTLIEQFLSKLSVDDYHFNGGMHNVYFALKVLFENSLGEYAYKLLTATGAPSFSHWFEHGATTLWETWVNEKTDSKNHHAYSCVLALMFKGFLGVYPMVENAGYKELNLKPFFAKDLDYCKGKMLTPYGEIALCWERKDGMVEYTVNIPNGIKATFDNSLLNEGENKFIINEG